MLIELLKQVKTATLLVIFFLILTGLLYPVVITGIAQSLFSWRANGSLLWQEKQLIGSELIGQSFTQPRYFWGRPSGTASFPYNAASSGSHNFGALNSDFLTLVKKRCQVLHEMDPKNVNKIPVDLVTESASGLDPEISPVAAKYQINRIAKARNLSAEKIAELVTAMTKQRVLHVLGEPTINILQLNIALDALDKNSHHKVQ